MCSRWNEARLKTIRLSLRVSAFIGICKALPWWFRNAVRTEQRLDAIQAEPSQLTDEETEAQPGRPRRGSHLSRSATRKVRSAASGTSFVSCSSLLSPRVWGEVELNVDLWSGPNPCPRPPPSFAGPSVTLWLPPAPFLFPK